MHARATAWSSISGPDRAAGAGCGGLAWETLVVGEIESTGQNPDDSFIWNLVAKKMYQDVASDSTTNYRPRAGCSTANPRRGFGLLVRSNRPTHRGGDPSRGQWSNPNTSCRLSARLPRHLRAGRYSPGRQGDQPAGRRRPPVHAWIPLPESRALFGSRLSPRTPAVADETHRAQGSGEVGTDRLG